MLLNIRTLLFKIHKFAQSCSTFCLNSCEGSRSNHAAILEKKGACKPSGAEQDVRICDVLANGSWNQSYMRFTFMSSARRRTRPRVRPRHGDLNDAASSHLTARSTPITRLQSDTTRTGRRRTPPDTLLDAATTSHIGWETHSLTQAPPDTCRPEKKQFHKGLVLRSAGPATEASTATVVMSVMLVVMCHNGGTLEKESCGESCAQGCGQAESPQDTSPARQVGTESCPGSLGHQSGTKECQNSVKRV